MYKLFLTLVVLVATPVHAAEIRCDGCDYVEAAVRAKQMRTGDHYVYSLTTGVVRRFSVEMEREPTGYVYYVMPGEVEPDVLDAVTALAAIWLETGGTMKTYWEIEGTGPVGGFTGFDVARPGAARSTLFDWVWHGSLPRTFSSLGAALQAYGSVAINILKSNPLQTTMAIRFSDGSKIIVSLDALTASTTVIEARDSLGNPIPTTAEEAVGINFDFRGEPSGQAYREMHDWLIRLGVQFGTTSGRNLIGCVTAGGQVVCSGT